MKQIHGPNIFDRNVRTDVAYSNAVHAIAKFHFVGRSKLNPFGTVCFELEERFGAGNWFGERLKLALFDSTGL